MIDEENSMTSSSNESIETTDISKDFLETLKKYQADATTVSISLIISKNKNIYVYINRIHNTFIN